MLKFYSFQQTNSNGYYLFKAREVIIQAASLDEAIEIAERETDVYEGFGRSDCDCCGPRWNYPLDDESGTITPEVSSWAVAKEKNIVIRYAD